MTRAIAILLSALLLIAASPSPQERSNARIFDRVWSLVAGRYWDKDFHGVDWPAEGQAFRAKAIEAANSAELYAVINTMLAKIGDSHVYARSPTQLVPRPPRGDDKGWNRRATWVADNVLLIAFDQFEPGDDRWIARSLRDEKPHTVIIDLRRNVGGDSEVLDRIAGLLVAGDHVLIRLNGRRDIEERSKGAGARAFSGPLAILTGPRTASAAEILAAFLDDSGRAISIGERTKGAVTGGVDHRLPDGGRLTIAEYDIHLPGGRRLERQGFTPRHIVPATKEGDPALATAIRLLAPGSGASEDGAKLVPRDQDRISLPQQ